MTDSASFDNTPIQMVVGYDFSDTARISLERAITLAGSEPRHVLHVLAVLDGKDSLGLHNGIGKRGKASYEDSEVIMETLRQTVAGLLDELVPDTEINFFVHARIGTPAEQILGLARDVGAHLIVVGSHGRTGLRRMFMGSVSEKVVREALCPVFVVRPRGYRDVSLQVIVDAPEGHAEESPYIKPHRYSYSNNMVERKPDTWPTP